MLCKNCNTQIEDNAKFCNFCGAAAEVDNQPTAAPVSAPQQQTVASVYMPQQQVKRQLTVDDLPDHLRPLSPWSYFGLQILFAVPIVGFIFLIIFTFNRGNINRRNFTRSYWCFLIIIGIVFLTVLIIALFTGAIFSRKVGYYY